jgi:hypothetical protein
MLLNFITHYPINAKHPVLKYIFSANKHLEQKKKKKWKIITIYYTVDSFLMQIYFCFSNYTLPP